MRKLTLPAIVLVLTCLGPASIAGSPTDWLGSFDPGGFFFGARPGYQDGYDGLPVFTTWDRAGAFMLLYRTNGPDWSGPSGLYGEDRESPIPDGGSHTWWDIRLWAYNYTPPYGNGDRVGTDYVNDVPAPVGYWGQLVLDYVPAHLNWTGETQWYFPLWSNGGYGVPALPCPITDDPFSPDNVTRMHLTVYTYNPVPEPSSLLALVAGLAGVGWRLRRR